jgi:hypothetical protein
MPGDPHECRKNAKLCREIARASRAETDRRKLHTMARRWSILAYEYEVENLLLAAEAALPVASQEQAVPRGQSKS